MMGRIRETWINPSVEIKETKNTGKGMFAVKPIQTGEKS